MLTSWRVLVPLAAGTLGWCYLTGERKIERSLTFGSIAGLGLFWLLFRALARPVGPQAAAWGAAIALAISALALAWFRDDPTDRMTSPLSRELSPIECAIGAMMMLVVGVSTYAASGSLLSFSETMELHVPLVASMQRGNWPPIDLREPPHLMQYHWGTHALAAGLANLAGRDAADLALFATNGVTSALAFGAGLLLVCRHVGFLGGLLGAIAMFGAGTLNWLSVPRFAAGGAWIPLFNPWSLPFTMGNLIIGGFFWRLHANSTSWAMCCALVSIELIALSKRTRLWAYAVAAGIALALVAPTNETTFSGILVAIGGVMAVRACLEKPRSAPLVLGAVVMAVGVLLAPLLGGLFGTVVATEASNQEWRVSLNLAHLGEVPSWNFGGHFGDPSWIPIFSLRFLQDAGPLPLLAAPILVLAIWCRAWPMAILSCASLALLMATTVFTLKMFPANVFRMLSASVSLAGLAFGYAVVVARSRLRSAPLRAVATGAGIAAVVFLVAAWPLHWVGLRCCNQPAPWPTANGGAMIDGPAVQWLKENTRFDEPILTLPPGRSEIAPSGQVNPKGNYLGARPEFPQKAAAAVAGPDVPALRAMGVRFLYVVESEATTQQRAVLADAEQARSITSVWRDVPRGRTLFRIEGVPAAVAR